MRRANSSLPVPDSPVSITVASLRATWRAIASASRSSGDWPMIARRVSRLASCALSWRFSARSAWRSSAKLTDLRISARLIGLVMKSYAPSFIPCTASSTVPNAVIKMTSISGRSERTSCNSSIPSTPGIITSVTIRCSGSWRRARSSAC